MEPTTLADRLNFLAELSGMTQSTGQFNVDDALGSGRWWLRPALDGAFFFAVWHPPEMRRFEAGGWVELAGETKPIIATGFARYGRCWGYKNSQEPRLEEGQVAYFLTRPPRIREDIDFAECVPPEDRCPGTLLEILGALKTPTFASLRAEALGLDLSEEAYDLLARRGIKTARDLRREVATKMAPVLAAIRAGPG